ncbi:hypothetical protein [Pelagicoccus sp. SDUM812002]|uniref:hypothetical protein n=1 Tax=Pelagicoccus sp. SDUM812002 TaxID=3041266 RepID=UPI00280CDF04|nr:hypothetical protein [Pelagicoccus sp. SDUM812002]MDQ8184018.1 hypothetical protein [Pelagicoccus sp. SDUM812002]
MIRILPVYALAFALLLTGCESTQLTISPVPTQNSGESSDAFALEKTHRVSVELLTPTFSRKYDELPTFVVVIDNQGEESILFGTNNVKLRSGSQQVPGYTFDEYVKLVYESAHREADEYGARQAEVTLGSQNGHRNEMINDNSQAVAKISAAKRTNDAAAKQEAANRIGDGAVEMINFHQINPGKSLEGLVKFHGEKIQADEPLTLIVTIAGEVYEFEFLVSSKET